LIWSHLGALAVRSAAPLPRRSQLSWWHPRGLGGFVHHERAGAVCLVGGRAI